MYFAFGIASLVLAVISIFVPGVGIMIAGLSGFLAWMSIGKGLPLGAAAVILNLINVLFLSPTFLSVVSIEASLRTPDQTEDFRIWALVLFVQIAAVVIFICNFIIDKVLENRRQRKRQTSAIDEKPTAPAAPWLSAEGNRLNQSTGNTEDIPQITKVLIDKIHGGRQKDSKFWTADHDFSGGDGAGMPIRISPEHTGPEKLRKAFGIPSYPIIALIIVVAVLIMARPVLFQFFEKKTIVDSTIKEISLPKIVQAPPPDRTNRKQIQPSPGKPHSVPQISIAPQESPTESKHIQPISTAGKVFSWRDREGKLFFSNTDFPLDNDTLQVQTEINTYHKATKIKIVGNQIFIPVTIGNNGQEVQLDMLLDTGSSQTTIPFKYLDKISPTYLGNVTSTLADGSKAIGKKAVIDFIKVGAKRENEVAVTGQTAGSSNSGLLGFDFLKNNSFKIDFENRFIVWM